MTPPPTQRLVFLLCLLFGLALLTWSGMGEWNGRRAVGQGIPATPTFGLFLPLIQADPAAGQTPSPTALPTSDCERSWDPRLDQRGATFLPATVTPGEGYWCLIRAVWYNSEEAQGRRNIFVDLLDEAGNRQAGLPVLITWPHGQTTITTQLKPGEPYAADFPMQSIAPAYRAQVNDGAPSDAVDGMGLGEIDDPLRAHHTSYGLVWQWTIAATATPTPTPTLTATVTPTGTATSTLSPTLTITSTASLTMTVTPSTTPTPSSTPTATPTSTATVTSTLPFQATFIDCTPDDQGTRFSGTVFADGQPLDGQRIVFRFGVGYGDPATQPVISGPNPPGFYTHIISAGFASQGTWSTWLVDADGAPLSNPATFTTDGPGGECNVATVDFVGGAGRAGGR